MTLTFSKMNGAGNDFVLLDNRSLNIHLTRDQIVRLCDRQKGVGADGVLLVVPSVGRAADWAWEFYNRDGSTAEMCGNGARCFARFVQRLTHANGRLSFETGAGVIQATFQAGQVTVNLTAPHGLKLNQRVFLASGQELVHSLNTGVPHAVVFVPDADRATVRGTGRELRFHAFFAPEGTNVNFVQILGPNSIRVRTYERGVEGETLACGTGVAASALISSRIYGFVSPVEVHVRSGDRLEVSFAQENEAFSAVNLTGPADFVFHGEIEI